MTQENKVTICSALATDIFLDAGRTFIREQQGGPALHISKVFEKEHIPFVLHTPKPLEVEILITPEGEYGRVKSQSAPLVLDFSSIETPYLLISTILEDFDLQNLSQFRGQIFFDIQGYVRDGKEFGKKKHWDMPKDITGSIFCLKGTEEEMENIPSEMKEAQKQKVLLITKGKEGCELFVAGKRYVVEPDVTVQAEHAVGAGDTFFAHFIAEYIRKQDALGAVSYATRKTAEFLSG